MRARLLERLRRETPALPLDLFRILAGGLVFFYFLRTLREVPAFSSPDGLLDHELIRDIFWYTKWNLFFPGLGEGFFQALYALACFGSLAIVVGWRPRTWALFLSIVASCTYRWNFPILYVDDGTMHLVLVWLALLPVGRTLTLSGWLREGSGSWERWLAARVPGTAVRCFLANVCLIYLSAGLWKFESPMWREGIALYAILRLPISHAPNFWSLEHLPMLRVANDVALWVEPLIPVLLLLRGGPWLRGFAFLCQMGFHVGILATMNVPFANIALMATAVLFFRREVMAWVVRRGAIPTVPVVRGAPARMTTTGKLSVALLVLISLAQLRKIPLVGEVHKPAFGILWVAGIAQEYRLFNWIDHTNFHAENELILTDAKGDRHSLDPALMVTDSVHALPFQMYLQDVPWIGSVSRNDRERLKRSFLERMAARFAREHEYEGSLELVTHIQRIEPGNLEVDSPRRRLMLRFDSHGGEADVRLINLVREDWGRRTSASEDWAGAPRGTLGHDSRRGIASHSSSRDLRAPSDRTPYIPSMLKGNQ